MKKMRILKKINIVIIIMMICIIPIKVKASKINMEKQSDNPYINMEITKKEEKQFIKEYKEYNISQKGNKLYYKDKLIRCFADIYHIVEMDHTGKFTGQIITCKCAYQYFNENGTVDIYVERTKKKDNSFGKIIKKGTALKDFIFVMPKDIIKETTKQLNKKGQYKKLIEVACFIDENTIREIAKKMAEKEKYEELLEIACFVNRNTMGEIAKNMTDKKKYEEVLNFTWCINQNDIDEIAKKMAKKKRYKEISDIGWAISKGTLEEIAKKMAEEEEYEALKNIAYYIA